MNHKITSALALGGVLLASAAGVANADGHDAVKKSSRPAGSNKPIHVSVVTPSSGEKVTSGFNVDVGLESQNSSGNRLLSGYKTGFLDPTGPDGKDNPDFHPGASETAPGLVVTLSTTPKMDGTPLVGPQTNLAGVFQINSVAKDHGLTQTYNDWQITSPGFFGQNTTATLKVYAVEGQAPDAIPAGGLRPVSNVVTRTFRIGG
jgi:hypothetical protein